MIECRELMTEVQNTCPLCGSEVFQAFLTAKDHLLTGESFTISRCNACDFTFTLDVPPPGRIGAYYKSQDYISHSDTAKGLMNRLYHLGRNVMLAKKYRMVRKASLGRSLLDIGSGTGYFPAFMKSKGYNATGVEIDPDARAFAEKNFGLKVYSPEDFLRNNIEGSFDVISLWHVLEHLDDFDAYIETMLDYLNPGGALVIALPNCSSFDARHYKAFWAGYDVPRHLWHFTPATMKLLAEKHGLNIDKMKRLPLDPFYNSMLSEKYRKNKLYMVSGFFVGMIAYTESLFNIGKSSSVVYFLTTKAPKDGPQNISENPM